MLEVAYHVSHNEKIRSPVGKTLLESLKRMHSLGIIGSEGYIVRSKTVYSDLALARGELLRGCWEVQKDKACDERPSDGGRALDNLLQRH